TRATPDAIAQQLGMQNLGAVGSLPGVYLLRANGVRARDDARTSALLAVPGVLNAQQQFGYPRELLELPIADPDYPNAWHLENSGQDSHGNGGGLIDQDIDVQGAWDPNDNGDDADGVSGAGVVVGVVDDGIQYTNPDLDAHYRADLDYDYSDFDEDGAAVPAAGDAHGTSVSGVIGAERDNNKCSTGVAYDADIASLRLLGSTSNPLVGFDAATAGALSHRIDQIDLYNNSWGYRAILSFANEIPLQGQALQLGITSGRGGLGSVYVFSAGNSGFYNVNTNHSPLTSTRHTITVGGSNYNGQAVWYSTRGSGVFVNAPTAGDSNTSAVKNGIFTTDIMGEFGYNDGSDSAVNSDDSDCTSNFNGTSASAPITSGVVALILAANPALSWRDVQHILAQTADQNDLGATGRDAWQTNAAGVQHSHAYGFGRVNAGAAIAAAKQWVNLPSETMVAGTVITVAQSIPDLDPVGITTTYAVPVDAIPADFVVEHVVVRINLPHVYAGDIAATLTSPSGVRSELLTSAFIGSGFPNGGFTNDFPLLSVAQWGETAADLTGTWTLHVRDEIAFDYGALDTWQLVFYGYNTTTSLAAPTQLTVAPLSDTELTLTWLDHASSETAYLVEQTTTPADSDSWLTLPALPADSTSSTISGLTTCTTYYFRVRAANGDQYSAYTNLVSGKPQLNGGCPTDTLQIIAPAPNQMLDLLGVPEVRFSGPQTPKKFVVRIIDAQTGNIILKTRVKNEQVVEVCTGGICAVDLSVKYPDVMLANGTYRVVINAKYADDTRVQSTPVTFSVSTPVDPRLISPSYAELFEDAAGLTAFVWAHQATAEQFKIAVQHQGVKLFSQVISASTTPSLADVCDAEQCTLPVPPELTAQLVNSSYYYRWSVQARNTQGKAKTVGYFFVYTSGTDNDLAYPYTPGDGTVLKHPDELMFAWVQGADDSAYTLQFRDANQADVMELTIRADTSPSIIDLCQTNTEIRICQYPLNNPQRDLLLNGQSYAWRLKVEGASENYRTPWWAFTLKYQAPIPTNQLPIPDGIAAANPLFNWLVKHPADTYTLTITGDSYVFSQSFAHNDVCSLTDDGWDTFWSCTVNFHAMPVTGASVTLPDGAYTWYVSSHTGTLVAGSNPTQFTVISGSAAGLSARNGNAGGGLLPLPLPSP
ncbi:MAG: S8 family serine peptidase, partial [Armatimonadetes bacterium]|nr:S8 family serine peptidase [Anaerolineae bacterium]